MSETDREQHEAKASDPDGSDANVRAPEGAVETVIANFRPQPAIPAIFVLLLTIIFAVMSQDPGATAGAGGSVLMWLIPVGIVASCGLAIAAGFCSLFPQVAWILVAGWALKLTVNGPLPTYNRYVLLAGMLAAIVMIVAQIWRVRTGKFTPTIRVES